MNLIFEVLRDWFSAQSWVDWLSGPCNVFAWSAGDWITMALFVGFVWFMIWRWRVDARDKTPHAGDFGCVCKWERPEDRQPLPVEMLPILCFTVLALLVLFYPLSEPQTVLFNNDMPLGVMQKVTRWGDVSAGLWDDVNTIGQRDFSKTPTLTWSLAMWCGVVNFGWLTYPIMALEAAGVLGLVVWMARANWRWMRGKD